MEIIPWIQEVRITDPEGTLWVDFTSEPPEVCEPILQRFNFHQLAIDDALLETHVPKLDDWGDYLYIVLNVLRYHKEHEAFHPQLDELDVFLGNNFVVTHHDRPLDSSGSYRDSCQRDIRHVQDGPDHLLYRVDNPVATYMPLVEEIDQQIDAIEDRCSINPPRTLEKIFGLKRILLTMRRILLPQRSVLNKLARTITRDDRKDGFTSGTFMIIWWLHDLNESLVTVSGALDTTSVINNRLNDVMKT
jgi:magnesium transporter